MERIPLIANHNGRRTDFGTFTGTTNPQNGPLIDATEWARSMKRRAAREYREALLDLAEYQAKDLYSESSPLLRRFHALRDNDLFYAEAFGLDPQEVLALEAYGDAAKSVKFLLGRPNPHYMLKDEKWGAHGSGWAALDSALRKLPSLRNLDLNIPVFRIEREDKKLLPFLTRCSTPVYIRHGMTTDPEGGQLHYLSCSIFPSSHSNTPEKFRRGLMRIRSPSARFMNGFSVQGLVDGGEVLIPPGVITLCDCVRKKQRWIGEEVLVFELIEVSRQDLDPAILMIDDFTTEDITSSAKKAGLYRQ